MTETDGIINHEQQWVVYEPGVPKNRLDYEQAYCLRCNTIYLEKLGHNCDD